MDKLIFDIDASGLHALFHDLSNLSGAPLEAVAMEETGKILEACVSRTHARSVDQIKTSVDFRNRNLWEGSQAPKHRGDPVVATNKKGVQWFVDQSTAKPSDGRQPSGKRVGGKTFHLMNDHFHWSNDRWARFQAALGELEGKRADVQAAIKSRGLAKNSWYQIARSLGFDIDVPDYVKNAAPSNKEIYVNGTGIKFDEPTGFFIEIENKYPGLVTEGGARVLLDSIQARINYFDINMRKGVFDDLKRRAERYPGVFVS